MSQWIVAPPEGMTEIANAPEFFIQHVGAVELVSGCNARFYCCIKQRLVERPHMSPPLSVVLKIIQPFANVPEDMAMLARCMTERAPSIIPAGPWPPQLVR